MLGKNKQAFLQQNNIALVMTGDGVKPWDDSCKTYGGRTAWLSHEQLAQVKARQAADPVLGQAWCSGQYSSFENHGADTNHYFQAAGLGLNQLLQKAGLSGEMQRALDFVTLAADGQYLAVLDHYGDSPRYYYHSDGSRGPRVEPMLAYRYASSLQEQAFRQTREAAYPTLLFGQRQPLEQNHCSYVKEVRKIIVGKASSAVACQLYLPEGRRLDYTMADLLLLKLEQRYYERNGKEYVCQGVDLGEFLEQAGSRAGQRAIEICLQGQALCSPQTLAAGDITPGKYLLAFYSQEAATGRPVANQTELRLYGPNFECPDLLAFRLQKNSQKNSQKNEGMTKPRASLTKQPGATEQEILNAVFYICVRRPEGDLYYYYTEEELQQKDLWQTRQYRFNDHTVEMQVSCRGILLTDLLRGLQNWQHRPLALPANWSIQFAEKDGYHTNSATYVNTLAETAEIYQPMLAFEIKERFLQPSIYHQSQAGFHLAQQLLIYRQAASANETVLKGVLGVVVSAGGNGFEPGGYTVVARDKASGQKLAGHTVMGAMQGMPIGVAAPEVPGAVLADQEAAAKIVRAGDPKHTKVEFACRQLPFLTIQNGTQATCLTLTDLQKKAVPLPASLAAVEALLPSNQALMVKDGMVDPQTAELLAPTPAENLYIDGRKQVGGQHPYGYGALYLYQYQGVALVDLLRDMTIKQVEIVLQNSESLILTAAQLAASQYYIVDQHTQSKGVPNNTAASKRQKIKYEAPRLFNVQNGQLITGDILKIVINS